MHQAEFLDRYSQRDGGLQRMDARAKLIAFLALIVICVSTPPGQYYAFAVYFGLLVAAFAISRVPPGYVLKRASIVLPFILAVAIFVPLFKQGGTVYHLGPFTLYGAGLLVLWNVAAKSTISVLSIVLLGSTTSFPDLLKGLERLKVPHLLVAIVSFMYRYIFVLGDEASRMKRARDSRGWSGSWVWHAKVVGHMIGHLFLRSYERGERVYAAMTSRGYEGDIKALDLQRLHIADIVFATLLFSVALAARLVI